jgi:hypothetical protein
MGRFLDQSPPGAFGRFIVSDARMRRAGGTSHVMLAGLPRFGQPDAAIRPAGYPIG